MLDLLDKDIKSAFKDMFWELKETVSKNIKKNISPNKGINNDLDMIQKRTKYKFWPWKHN